MFNKLKEKLNGFSKTLGKKIDEKAVPLESAPDNTEIGENIENESIIDETSTCLDIPKSEESISTLNHISDNKDIQSEIKTVQHSEKKTGIFHKAKALVFERQFILDEKDLENPLWDLQMALLESDVALTVTEAIVDALKLELVGCRKKIRKDTSNIVEHVLKNALYNVMSANIFDFDDYVKNTKKPIHIVFVGINGTGKTTSIAKVAKRFKDMGYSVVLAAGDTFRAGAIDQLQIHAEKVGVKIIRHQEGGDPAAVVYDAVQYAKAHKVDLVLSDTAGRMHTNLNLMEQLKKICRVSAPDLIIFVDEAVAGNDAVERAAQFNNAVPIHGSILTKTDADAKGGAAISIAYITGKPILFLGMGQGYDDLTKFDPRWFVDNLF